MKEEIVDVVKAIPLGAGKSVYVVIPKEAREKLQIDDKAEFIVILASNGDILYRKRESKH